ncbi:DUF4270 domain-containing protein [Olivibacter jilunii]|uniref:DUF4270 domain-containing protein n=1 Tax=Olivibacter jilunii TaxID=985016 RepID=UPI003F177158
MTIIKPGLLGTKLFIYSSLIFLLVSCTKDGTISLSNTNDNIGAEIVDSITVRTATYQLDPLPSNGQGVLLVGHMNDEVMGNLTVSSYFRIGNSAISNVTLPDDAAFDSLSLALPYQGYYYGDTTLTQSFNLHRVTEEIELIDESNAWEEDEKPVFASGSTLFTNSAFSYDAIPLGSVSFKHRPKTKTYSKSDTVFVKANQSFGEDLWAKIKSGSSQVSNSEEFLEYIKGFVLVPTSKTSMVTAFATDSILMKVYYSYTRNTDGKKVQDSLNMKVDDGSYQFNSIKVDRSQSLISALKADTEAELPGTETKQQVMLQGLTGLVTKIQFPYLYEFVNRNDVIINKAELTIETPPNSHIPYTPPPSLNMMLADEHGVPKSLLTSSYETTTQVAYLANDLSGGVGNSKYTFNLTEYVSNYRGAMEDKKSSLYLTIPVSDLLTKVDRLLIGKGDGNSPIKLRILYTKY